MSQVEIIELLAKHKCLLSQQLVDKLRCGSSSTRETARATLAKMRKYEDVDWVKIDKKTADDFKEFLPQMCAFLENGGSIRRHTYLYFRNSKVKFIIKTETKRRGIKIESNIVPYKYKIPCNKDKEHEKKD